MSMSLANLTAEVLGYLEFDGTDDSEKFQITNNLNRTQDHLLNILPLRLVVNALDSLPVNLSSGGASYPLPDDFIRHVYLRLDFSAGISSSNIGRPARFIEPESWNNLSNIDLMPSAEYPAFTVGDDGELEIAPVPSGNVTDGGLLRFVKRLPTITASQECELRDNLRNLLVWRTTALCARVDNYNLEIAGVYDQLFRDELEFLAPSFIRKEN